MIGDAAKYYVEAGPAAAYSTGFFKLDQVTNGGLRAGEVSLVGAATGGGKSAFGEQLALNLSRSQQHGVLYVPLELGSRITTLRMAAKIERCSYDTVQRHGFSDSTLLVLNDRSLWTWEPGSRGPCGVTELIQAISDFDGVQIVIIDHVREIDGWLVSSGSHVGATSIVQRLRQFAYERNLHIVLLCQMNRSGYGKRPQIHNLQDTSALEQNASLVMLLHRPYQFKGKEDYVAEILIPKNRHGLCCMLHYRWVGETMSLWPFSDEDEQRLTCCGGSGATVGKS